MKWHCGLLVCCAVLITVAGATVASSQEVALVCCEAAGACPVSQLCCDANIVGLEPCDGDNPNYCMEVCRRVAGATFTPD